MTVTDSWRAQAACRGLSPDLFVPELPETNSKADREEFARQVNEACEVCEGCPVKSQCWWFAFDHGLEGVWGGQLLHWHNAYTDVGQYLAMRDGRRQVARQHFPGHYWHDGSGPRIDTFTRSELLSSRITAAEEPEYRQAESVSRLAQPSRRSS